MCQYEPFTESGHLHMRGIHMHGRAMLCPLVIRCFYTDKYTPDLVGCLSPAWLCTMENVWLSVLFYCICCVLIIDVVCAILPSLFCLSFNNNLASLGASLVYSNFSLLISCLFQHDSDFLLFCTNDIFSLYHVSLFYFLCTDTLSISLQSSPSCFICFLLLTCPGFTVLLSSLPTLSICQVSVIFSFFYLHFTNNVILLLITIISTWMKSEEITSAFFLVVRNWYVHKNTQQLKIRYCPLLLCQIIKRRQPDLSLRNVKLTNPI